MMGDCGRAEMQTYTIALRLHRQEDLYQDEPELQA